MRCCAAEMAPHRNPPLPPQIQHPKTAGANSKLDKTWGQGQDLYRGSYGKKHPYSSMSHVRGRPFLIAIAPFDSDLSLSQNNELINMVLFGMAPPVLEGPDLGKQDK